MKHNIKLLLISDSRRFEHHQAMMDVFEQALQGGVDTILLREKALDSAKLLALASQARMLTAAHQARLIIHSQADIAKAVDADGVHVDAASISEISQMKRWLGEGFMVSASCHHEAELTLAEQQGADFCFLSPVFPTKSHPHTPALGAEAFLKLASSVDIPVIALGGISPDVIPLLQGHAVATMGGILDAENPKQAAAQLLSS